MSFMINISIECKERQIALFKRVLFLYVVAIAVRHRGETHEGDTHEGDTPFFIYLSDILLKNCERAFNRFKEFLFPPFPHFSSPYRKQGEIQNNEFFIVSLL